ncbi:MAG: hypothetical protein ACOVMG_01315 [Flavobacterium sp.]
MSGENLKKVIVAIQDYRQYGISNTILTGKGDYIRVEDYPGGIQIPRNLINYKKKIFEKILGEKFGNESIILEPKSSLFLELINAMDLKLKDLLKTQCREFLDHINYRYDEEVEFFGEKYIINGRNYLDDALRDFYEFYQKIKMFFDYNYPLYIIPLLLEDKIKYEGDFDNEVDYEPLKPNE